ncbi:MAG: hypothetical protein EXS08_00500 [Planctomycetes bacterium]|nr:hypothetical protein [Planctomycetota bacterium]
MRKKRLEQREFGFVNWGGKRRGAGRKPKGEHAGVSHRRRPRLAARHAVLVTMRVAAGLPSLRTDATHEIVRGAIAEVSERGDFRVIVYSVQTNHIHLVVEARSSDTLARGMNAPGARVAKRLNKFWRRRGQVFPDRFHSRALKTPRECRNALVYVLQNGRKHGAWSARRPDVYSSGPVFDGWTKEVDNRARSRPSYVGRPRTWLLTLGWRRHGLIEPREAPARAA